MQYEVEKLERQFKLLRNREQLKMFFYDALQILDSLKAVIISDFKPDYFEVYALDSDISLKKNHGANVCEDAFITPSLSIDAIFKRELIENQNPKRTYRLPGVISVNDDDYEVFCLMNEVKALIEKAFVETGILKNRERGAFAQECNPGKRTISLVELYRKVVTIEEPLESVSFTWGNHVPQIKTFTKTELLNELEQLKHADKDSGWNHGVDRDIAIVEMYPSYAMFRTTRTIPPHPRVNLKFINKIDVEYKGVMRSTNRLQKHGHLPLIIRSSTVDIESVKLIGLCDSEKERKKDRLDSIKGYEEAPILKGFMNLFVKAP